MIFETYNPILEFNPFETWIVCIKLVKSNVIPKWRLNIIIYIQAKPGILVNLYKSKPDNDVFKIFLLMKIFKYLFIIEKVNTNLSEKKRGYLFQSVFSYNICKPCLML